MKETDEKETKYGLLPSLSVNRPVTILMGLLTVLVLGAIAYFKIPIELIPSGLEQKRLNIYVDYRNSTPLDVLEKVVEPIEDIIGTVSGVERVHSRSSSSTARVFVFFHKDVDMKEAYSDVKDRMDRVLPDLPEDVERIVVRKWDSDDAEILFAAMTLDDVENPEYFLERYFQPALQRIDGVGNVQVWGLVNGEVRISFDKEKLRSLGVNVFELTNRLRNENFNLSAGRVVEGGQDYLVRSVGRLESLTELENLIIDPETRLRLKDIGDVYIDKEENRGKWRLEGGRSYGIEIKRSSGANIVEISEAVNAVFSGYENSERWPGIKFHVFWDQGKYIVQSIDNLKMSALWGSIFSIIVLLSFLRSGKITFTIAMAIPLSLLCSVVVLYFVGWTMNMLTMMGLLLSVGLVVDNAIVMTENIHSKRELGHGPKKAALVGATEVGLAITMATLTTVAVFLPLLLMDAGGGIRFYLFRIGIPVIASLLASLGIALLLIPLATKTFAENAPKSVQASGEVRGLNRLYQKILRGGLRDRALAMLVILAMLGLSYIPIEENWIQRKDGDGNGRGIYIQFELPGGLQQEEVGEIVDNAEVYVDKNRERYDYDTYHSYHSSGFARVSINFKSETYPWYETAYRGIGKTFGFVDVGKLSRSEIVKDLQANLPVPPGIRLRMGGGGGSGRREFNVTLYGDDTETLFTISEEVVRRLRSVYGVVGIDADVETSEQELNVTLDREQAQKLGISARDISGGIAYAVRGSDVGRFFMEDGRDIPIRAGLREEDRDSLSNLSRLSFPSASGAEVPLETLSSISFSDSARSIQRNDRKTSLRIRGILDSDNMRRTNEEVDIIMGALELPRGYRWDRGGGDRRQQEENNELLFAGIMIFVFVLFLMGVLFESFVLPMAVIVTVPLAGVGVVWTLVVTKTPFTFLAAIGGLILIGVVVNNGIVLIDQSQRLMRQGMERNAALIEASRRRFRPIWITSLTTMCGMIPMAVGGAKMMDMSYAPLGRVIFGGLLVSTILTLIVVPIFYSLLDDLRNWFMSFIRLFFGERGRRGEVVGRGTN